MQHHLKITLISSNGNEIISTVTEKPLAATISNTGTILEPVAFIKMIRELLPGTTLVDCKDFKNALETFLQRQFSAMESEQVIKTRINHMMDSLNLEELRNLEKISSFLVNETPHREDFNKFLKDK